MSLSNDTSIPEGYKRCSLDDKCVHPQGPVLPATTEYFWSKKHGLFGLASACLACCAIYSKRRRQEQGATVRANEQRYRDNHRERRRESGRRSAIKCRDKRRPYFKLYQQANRQKINEAARRQRKNNPQSNRQAVGRYRANHIEERRAYSQRYGQQYPERLSVQRNRRRSRLANAEGTHTAKDIKMLLRYSKGLCCYCKEKIDGEVHIDHVIPLSRGGSNAVENLVVSCAKCNLSKGSREPHEWIFSRFGEERGQGILARISTYLESAKD